MNAPHTDLLPPLLGGLLLLLLNGLLVALELALVRVRFSHFQPELVEKIGSAHLCSA
jgi:CBS domain containing-hemolysin-like protein